MARLEEDADGYEKGESCKADRARGYRLGSFLENEPTAEKTMIRGRGGSNAQRLGKQMREGHGWGETSCS